MNNKFEQRTRGLAQSVTHRVALKPFGLGFASMALSCLGFSAKVAPLVVSHAFEPETS